MQSRSVSAQLLRDAPFLCDDVEDFLLKIVLISLIDTSSIYSLLPSLSQSQETFPAKITVWREDNYCESSALNQF